ncbi:hypothetical protein ACCC88_04350 [Sphingomonas sp. Sphisp140]|uniref:hypothetical protein n=1 Tax=unclassified Sphingomonas TaxID=196159 RepID=UPI0039AFD143
MKVEIGRFHGFRRSGDELIKLLDVRDTNDHLWLSMEHLVRRQPPPGSAMHDAGA